jgi:hypothetical protein
MNAIGPLWLFRNEGLENVQDFETTAANNHPFAPLILCVLNANH